MTVTDSAGPSGSAGIDDEERRPSSLATTAARNLATTTKTVPQMQGITSRWLLRALSWVEVPGGAYRVNRRLRYAVGDGRVTFSSDGAVIRVIPQELRELPLLRGFDDEEVLRELAGRFVQREYQPGDLLAVQGQPVDEVFLLAHGKVNQLGAGAYGDHTVLRTLADGDYFGGRALTRSPGDWDCTIKAVTSCTMLALERQALEGLDERGAALRAHIDRAASAPSASQNAYGEAEVDIASGHEGEADLPATFVDYEVRPREYELSVAQTVLRVHTRVADLYNQPMNQLEHQLRLTIEALRERQEHELVNNPDFGLLHNADLKQRLQTRSGPPTPDDLDALLAMVWKEPAVFLAHPRTIAAIGRECNRVGVYPMNTDYGGHQVPSWRGVPILPCNKIPVTGTRTSSIMLLRTGEANQGVIGLHRTGLQDEYEPGLNVRFMGINEQAIMSYLVSTYHSAAVLVPDALAVLENVEIGRES
ncbi:family 2B encapsulin nanocompartment shell protein [Amycolatopsis marina]|uniref:family 2B encapsulin nanocompartment shell protein n=1 Tax=Amycolatopsis marina TaxID=490629 RepID=UPI003CCB9141